MTFLRDKQFCKCFRPSKPTFIPTVCLVFNLTKLFISSKSHDNVGILFHSGGEFLSVAQ